MNAQFDDIAANLGTRSSRRSILGIIAGGILGMAIGAVPADAARSKTKAKKAKGKNKKTGKRSARQSTTCPKAQQCGSVCCSGSEVCFDKFQEICAVPDDRMVG